MTRQAVAIEALPTDVVTRRLNAFHSLSSAACRAVSDSVMRTQILDAGHIIVTAGATARECHVLLEGIAASSKILPQGRRQIVRFAFPGDFLDLDGFIGRMDHSVTAQSRCVVGVIPHPVLRMLTTHHPDIATALWRHTHADAAVCREWVVNVGRRSASARVAHLLAELYLRWEEVGLATDVGGIKSFPWQMTQFDLADATGLSAVHVNRTVQVLRSQQLIDITRDEVTIFDWPGLKGIAEFEEDYLAAAKADRVHQLA